VDSHKWHDHDVGHWAKQRCCFVEFMFQWLLCLVFNVGLTRLTTFSCLRFWSGSISESATFIIVLCSQRFVDGHKWHDPDVGHWAEQRCYVEFMFQWLLCLVLDVGLTRLTMFSCLRFRD